VAQEQRVQSFQYILGTHYCGIFFPSQR